MFRGAVWGRLPACARLLTALVGLPVSVGRRVGNPPQDGVLPHCCFQIVSLFYKGQ